MLNNIKFHKVQLKYDTVLGVFNDQNLINYFYINLWNNYIQDQIQICMYRNVFLRTKSRFCKATIQ